MEHNRRLQKKKIYKFLQLNMAHIFNLSLDRTIFFLCCVITQSVVVLPVHCSNHISKSHTKRNQFTTQRQRKVYFASYQIFSGIKQMNVYEPQLRTDEMKMERAVKVFSQPNKKRSQAAPPLVFRHLNSSH